MIIAMPEVPMAIWGLSVCLPCCRQPSLPWATFQPSFCLGAPLLVVVISTKCDFGVLLWSLWGVAGSMDLRLTCSNYPQSGLLVVCVELCSGCRLEMGPFPLGCPQLPWNSGSWPMVPSPSCSIVLSPRQYLGASVGGGYPAALLGRRV